MKKRLEESIISQHICDFLKKAMAQQYIIFKTVLLYLLKVYLSI